MRVAKTLAVFALACSAVNCLLAVVTASGSFAAQQGTAYFRVQMAMPVVIHAGTLVVCIAVLAALSKSVANGSMRFGIALKIAAVLASLGAATVAAAATVQLEWLGSRDALADLPNSPIGIGVIVTFILDYATAISIAALTMVMLATRPRPPTLGGATA